MSFRQDMPAKPNKYTINVWNFNVFLGKELHSRPCIYALGFDVVHKLVRPFMNRNLHNFSCNPTRNILCIQATHVQAMLTKMHADEHCRQRQQNFVNLLLVIDGVDCDEKERKVKTEKVTTAISSILSALFNVTLLSGASKTCISSSPQTAEPFCLFTRQLPWDVPGLVKFHAKSETVSILGSCCAKNQQQPCFTSQLCEYLSSCEFFSCEVLPSKMLLKKSSPVPCYTVNDFPCKMFASKIVFASCSM